MDNNIYTVPTVQIAAKNARNLLAEKAVLASDGFRQWLYNSSYRFSIIAQIEIANLAEQGYGAAEIANKLYSAHS